MNQITVLLIDDHSLILEGYKNILLNDQIINYKIDTALNCQEAYQKLNSAKKGYFFYDVVCVDMNLPAFEEEELYSGEDLGILIRNWFPDSKLVVLTMHTDNFRIYNILKNLKPDTFLLKGDISPQEFELALRKTTKGEIYYSHSINSMMRLTLSNDFVLDKIDRTILYYLSKGIKTRRLSEFIPLSLAGIEKRKRVMKEIFDVEGGDYVLIEHAKKHGFL
ncbi:response regulator [Zunongwangia sp.]|uniref:response regulator n=1 Tax=Zunongwangia sp. TaxID=1965325 RepID=UPI003AA7F124